MEKLTINTINGYTLNDNEEIILAYHWNDEYGFKNSGVERTLYNTVAEAEHRYHALKNGNGGYVTAWFEIRKRGELNRMEELIKEIKKLNEELKNLEG